MQCPSSSLRAVPPALTVKPRLLRHLLLTVLMLLLVLGCGYAGYLISEKFAIAALTDSGERQLGLHARALESEISTHTYLPSLLELESGVSQLLLNPSEARRLKVNRYLEGLNRRSGSRAIFLLDLGGRVQATSNWRDADSFQGEDLSFRAYYQDAVQGKPASPVITWPTACANATKSSAWRWSRCASNPLNNAGPARACRRMSATRTASSSSPATPPCASNPFVP